MSLFRLLLQDWEPTDARSQLHSAQWLDCTDFEADAAGAE